MISLYDVNSNLSQKYKLKDFLVTEQKLSSPNVPQTAAHYDNLRLLADVKEELDAKIGPSRIISAYRTKELQNMLKSQGEPVASGTSFHEVGRGFDLAPTSMSIAQFFGKILASPMKSKFAEISLKPGQNSLHLAINVPGDIRTPKVTALNQQKMYSSLNTADIASYIRPFVATDAQAMALATGAITYGAPAALILGLAALGVFYFVFSRRRD